MSSRRTARVGLLGALVVALVLGWVGPVAATPASARGAAAPGASARAAAAAGASLDRAPAPDVQSRAGGPAPVMATRALAATPLTTWIIGYSVQHRAIVAREFGTPRAAFTAVVLGSIHGWWERAGETVTATIRTLKIPAGMNLWVIDTLNPDGDALHQRGNAHGVDLNRNWPNSWIPIAPGGAFDTHYSGPRALSEPETVAMYNFLRSVRPNRLVSLHQPLDGVDTTDGGAKDIAFRHALSSRLGLPEKALTCQSACHGTMTGWATHHSAITAITVEFPQTVAISYLSGRAAPGILAALMVGIHVAVPPPFPKIPAAQADAYVAKLFRTVLGRAGGAGSARSRALQAGTTSKRQVAQSITTSLEHRSSLAQTAFRSCLSRSAGPAGIRVLADAYLATPARASWSALLGRLCGSAEASGRAGGNRTAWVDRVYVGVIGRHATAAERVAGVADAARRGLPAAATSIARSSGANRHWLDQLVYRPMLGRSADPSGVSAFAPLMSAAGPLTVPVAVATSGEFAR